MKKNVVIVFIVLLALSLTTFGFMNSKDAVTALAEIPNIESIHLDKPEIEKPKDKPAAPFFYELGTRFKSFKKTDLDKVTSYNDFIGEEHVGRIVSFKSLSVTVLDNHKETDIIEMANHSGVLSPSQLELLRSSDISTNLAIKAVYIERNKNTGVPEESHWTPYITIVPEKQATYSWGKEALIYFLTKNNTEVTNDLEKGQIKAGKLLINISKEGKISKAEILSTSGYPNVDEKVKELVFKLPGTWQPAENVNGDKVDQTLVISFGNMGC